MAAPATTTRQTPTGYKMPDGYQSFMTFANKPSLKVWERQVKPPGIDGGEPIDTTTMHNTAWRTREPRHLRTLDAANFMAAYDPESYSDLLTLINSNQAITIRFPDNSTLAFFGYLQKVEFGELKEGEMPEMTLSIVPTNWDSANKVEASPVFTGSAGT